MDQTEPEPTHMPVEGAPLELRACFITLAFSPEIRLQPVKGFEFATHMTGIIDFRDVRIGEQTWVFSQPTGSDPKSRMTVLVTSTKIQIDTQYPAEALELFENKTTAILGEFTPLFSPTAIVETSAMVRAQLAIDGDARQFLVRHVMNMDLRRVDPFKRPIHGVGLRLFFPAFSIEREGKTEDTDWQLNLKAESLLADPSQLFIEAEGRWPTPVRWTYDAVQEAVGRLRTVKEYLDTNVIAFLKQWNNSE